MLTTVQLGGPTEIEVGEKVELLSARPKSNGSMCHVQGRSGECGSRGRIVLQ